MLRYKFILAFMCKTSRYNPHISCKNKFFVSSGKDCRHIGDNVLLDILHYNLSQRWGRSHNAENEKNHATFVAKCCHDTRLVVMALRVLYIFEAYQTSHSLFSVSVTFGAHDSYFQMTPLYMYARFIVCVFNILQRSLCFFTPCFLFLWRQTPAHLLRNSNSVFFMD